MQTFIFFRLRTNSIFFNDFSGLLRRCYQCRSRGDLGTCKDAFVNNVTLVGRGVSAVPCASGWCGKVIEGGGSLRDDGM